MGMVGEKSPSVAGGGICSGQQIGEMIHHVILLRFLDGL